MKHIVLDKRFVNRSKALKMNKCFNIVHRIISFSIFTIFIYFALIDSTYLEIYHDSKVSYLISILAMYALSYALTSFLMCIPSGVFAQYVSPEVFLLDDFMIYLGGSTALHYIGSIGILFHFFKYLLPYEESTVIKRDDILSISFEKAAYLKPSFGKGSWIAIKHRNGQILTGIWIEEQSKAQIIEDISRWRNEINA